MSRSFPGIWLNISPGYASITLMGGELGPDYLEAGDIEGISPSLEKDLGDWCREFLSIPFHPVRGMDPSPEYRVRGWNLARRLARELGPAPPVCWQGQLALDAPRPHD